MAVRQINTAAFDYQMMLESINKSYKGKNDITISEFDSTAAPDVKVGSVFEDNGAIFLVETADETPTGYAGISSSTTFYLYWDEDPGAFIYSETVPTWNDALQGWYNGNDRAFFSMFKDSGDTLYEQKRKFEKQTENPITLSTKVIPIGDWDMVATAGLAIAHSISNYKNIRSVSVIIINDSDTVNYDLNRGSTTSAMDGGLNAITATEVTLSRVTSGWFDDTDFNATSFNRGWITIVYEE